VITLQFCRETKAAGPRLPMRFQGKSPRDVGAVKFKPERIPRGRPLARAPVCAGTSPGWTSFVRPFGGSSGLELHGVAARLRRGWSSLDHASGA